MHDQIVQYFAFGIIYVRAVPCNEFLQNNLINVHVLVLFANYYAQYLGERPALDLFETLNFIFSDLHVVHLYQREQSVEEEPDEVNLV